MVWVAVASGGALGAMARHALNAGMTRAGALFPGAIFMVNAIGCLLIGLLAGLVATTRLPVGEVGRSFLFVGVLGGFTTFSSFSLDTFTLLRSDHAWLAALNAIGQVVVGLAAVWLGYSIGTWRS